MFCGRGESWEGSGRHRDAPQLHLPLLGDARPEVHAPVRPGGIRQAVADGGYGTMMALRGTRTIRVTLIEGAGELKLVTPD